MSVGKRLTFGSLFAGIDGFDLGFERAGLECKWQVEIREHATTILQEHWPHVTRHGDVRTFDGTQRQWAVDVLAGGFPCQDVSLCGKRAGLQGERSQLFWEFVRIAEETGPRWLVIENVLGLLAGNGGRDFLAVLCALAERGYVCAYRVFDARYFGVPQSRERVFLIGHLGDWTGPARVLFDSGSVLEGYGDCRAKQNRTASEIADGAPFVFQTRIARCKRGLPSATLPTLTSYEEGGIHSDSKPHVVTADGIRRLTPIEHERAQGFPDNWTAGLSDRDRRMLVGNSVVPAIAEWIGCRIIEVSNV